MKVKLEMEQEEVEAVIMAHIAATWPCIPGHRWDVTLETFADIEIKAVPDARQEEHEVQQ